MFRRFIKYFTLFNCVLLQVVFSSDYHFNVTPSGSRLSGYTLKSRLSTPLEDTLNRYKSQKVRCILSVDGGGMRGIIPALFLKQIEAETEKSIFKLFDVFSGTSAGAIITLALNCPDAKDMTKPAHTASKIANIFINEGQQIFPRNILDFFTCGLISLAYGPKFDHRPLEKLLEKYFKGQELKDSLKPIFIASVVITSGEKPEPYYFDSVQAATDSRENFYMRDCARASSAATTYYKSAVIENFDGCSSEHADGGLVANNPESFAYDRAREIFPGSNDLILVFSFGTGDSNTEYIPGNSGAALSAGPIISSEIKMQSGIADYELLTHKKPQDDLIRIQCILDRNIDLCDTNIETIDYLRTKATAQKSKISIIAKFLLRNFEL